MNQRISVLWAIFAAVLGSFETANTLAANKPNILIIWGDDIGYWNLSCINNGMMGYKTPNIDRLAREGMW